jgi:Cytochrome c554 and c-prime
MNAVDSPETSHRHPRAVRFFSLTCFLICRMNLTLQLAIVCVASLSIARSFAQTAVPSGISLPTETRVQSPGWWPTKTTASRDDFIGAAACAKCHAAQSAATNAMSHAATRAADAPLLHLHDHLSLTVGPYHEEIVTHADKTILTVSNGSASLSADLLWAFGVGNMGQTYVYKTNGSFYESHLSYFSSSQGLGITPGQTLSIPASIEAAAGRRIPPAEAQHCFSCHTTASVSKNQFDPDAAVLGVTCEACHGPGANHAAAMKSGMQDQAADLIMNPKQLDPVASVDFCGACHRTWEDVVTSGFTGIGVYNVRFAPYRLENSKCWGRQPDARLTCIACHDPHQPLEHDAATYDSRCLQCHINQTHDKTLIDTEKINSEKVNSEKIDSKKTDTEKTSAEKSASHPTAPACPVATRNCATCHMPKIETPVQHSIFTDHWIRIVRSGQPYPD